MIAATATSPRGRTSSSTGRSCATSRRSSTDLASVEMHAIQTSGNCIRNITTDQFAGAAADEIIDPRPVAEILRQWSSLHPEFTYLPRKFKIAMTGAPNDRAAIRFHDIGLQATTNADGEIGWEVWVGGGLGRTPMIGKHDHALRAARAPARLSREHPARLQPLWPARQQVQGAHQDPRPRERHRHHPRAGRGGVRPREGRRADTCRRKSSTASPSLLRCAGLRAGQRRRIVDVAREKILEPGLWPLARAQPQCPPPARLCLASPSR